MDMSSGSGTKLVKGSPDDRGLDQVGDHGRRAMITILGVLLPHLAGLRVNRVLVKGRTSWLHTSVVAAEAACSSCSMVSGGA